MNKQCPKCNTSKPLDEFYHNKARSDKHDSWCKVCADTKNKAYAAAHPDKLKDASRLYNQRPEVKYRVFEYYLNSRYGAGAADYRKEKFDAQGGKCAICGRSENELTNRLSLDHNHDTGQWRGLLCTECNSAVGLLRENEELFMAAIKYLEIYR